MPYKSDSIKIAVNKYEEYAAKDTINEQSIDSWGLKLAYKHQKKYG